MLMGQKIHFKICDEGERIKDFCAARHAQVVVHALDVLPFSPSTLKTHTHTPLGTKKKVHVEMIISVLIQLRKGEPEQVRFPLNHRGPGGPAALTVARC